MFPNKMHIKNIFTAFIILAVTSVAINTYIVASKELSLDHQHAFFTMRDASKLTEQPFVIGSDLFRFFGLAVCKFGR
jgi:hypothetical protein